MPATSKTTPISRMGIASVTPRRLGGLQLGDGESREPVDRAVIAIAAEHDDIMAGRPLADEAPWPRDVRDRATREIGDDIALRSGQLIGVAIREREVPTVGAETDAAPLDDR